MTKNPAWDLYFYPRSPYGERRQFSAFLAQIQTISTHALRMESDSTLFGIDSHQRRFLPTLSVWRATVSLCHLIAQCFISTHALRMESDIAFSGSPSKHQSFLPTLSVWRATSAQPKATAMAINFYPRSPYGERPAAFLRLADEIQISTHALRMESDFCAQRFSFSAEKFLPTLSVWRATDKLASAIDSADISTHALRMESDSS